MDPLLKLLEEHALRSPQDLSKMLNVPAHEVQRRIKQYEDDKVILGYKAVINDDKVDTDLVKAVIEVRIQPEREGGFDRIAKRIARFDEVNSLFLMSGGYDLLIFVEGHSLRQVAQFVADDHDLVDPGPALVARALAAIETFLAGKRTGATAEEIRAALKIGKHVLAQALRHGCKVEKLKDQAIYTVA